MDVSLNYELINSCLHDIRNTVDGLLISAIKFVCCEKFLKDINLLSTFVYLRYINVNYNKLTDLNPIENLQYLIVLNVSHNELSAFPEGNWPSLTHLDLSNNHINKLTYIKLPRLMVLFLNNNHIKRLTDPLNGNSYFVDYFVPQLQILSLSNNYIEFDESSIDLVPFVSLNLNLTKLKALYIGFNCLMNLATYSTNQSANSNTMQSRSAIGILPKLSVLHIRNANLLNLDGISADAFPELEYLNLRNNQIQRLEEIKKIGCFLRLRTVILTDNPVFEEKDYRLELRLIIRSLKRLDKDFYTSEENEEADELILSREQNS